MSRRAKLLAIFAAILVVLVVMLVPTATDLILSAQGRASNVTAERAACERSIPKNVAWINQLRLLGDPKSAQLALVLDAQTDESAWRGLDNPVDQINVRDGMHGKPPFRCDIVFPPSRLVP